MIQIFSSLGLVLDLNYLGPLGEWDCVHPSHKYNGIPAGVTGVFYIAYNVLLLSVVYPVAGISVFMVSGMEADVKAPPSPHELYRQVRT